MALGRGRRALGDTPRAWWWRQVGTRRRRRLEPGERGGGRVREGRGDCGGLGWVRIGRGASRSTESSGCVVPATGVALRRRRKRRRWCTSCATGGRWGRDGGLLRGRLYRSNATVVVIVRATDCRLVSRLGLRGWLWRSVWPRVLRWYRLDLRSVRVVNRRRGRVLVEHRLRWCAVLSTVPTAVWNARGRSRGSLGRNSRACGGKRRVASRDLVRGLKETIAANGEVVRRACSTNILRGHQFEERNRLLDEGLRREQVCILEVPVVQPRQLVRPYGRVINFRLQVQVLVDVIDRLAEDRHLLDEGLQRERVRSVQ